MNLPLKTFYTIDQAVGLLHALYPQRVDIDRDYLLMLGIKGYIRIAIQKETITNGGVGTIVMDSYEGSSDINETIEHIKITRNLFNASEEVNSLFVITGSYLDDLLYEKSFPLKEIHFDNIYSTLNNYFTIPDQYLEKLGFFSFANNVHPHELYDIVMYSTNKEQIWFTEDFLAKGYPPREENDDWSIAFWFKDNMDYNKLNLSNDLIVKNDDLCVFGEDLQLLLDGKHREPIGNNYKIKKNNIEAASEQLTLHPRRANSINQIIYALTKMADLDLSQHQSAYTQLEAFCNSKGIEIPKKDTSGNLFKEIYRAFNTENSK